MVSSNPVDPLMRAIPKLDTITDLMLARCRYYERQYAYLVDRDPRLAEALMKPKRPEGYEGDIKFYDAMYIGGAPKEK